MNIEMYTDREFINFLEESGCALRAAGDRLRCVVPGGGPLTDELRREITRRKKGILGIIRDRRVPLSYEQERLWFLNELSGPRESAYHMPAAFRLRGGLDKGILAESFNVLRARHESLRTVFGSERGVPFQEIRPPGAVRLREEDIDEALLESILAAEALRPFDLGKGHLTRIRLLRLGPDDHVLTFCQHHIVGDGWSTGILLKELSEYYAALASRKGLELPATTLQYADYALWQRSSHWLERLRPQEEYWRGKLEGLEYLEILPDLKRPAVKTYRGMRVGFEIGADSAGRIAELAEREGATPYMVLLAALQALLSRMCSSHDIVVGTPVAGRSAGDLEGTVGFFVNTLVMRTSLDGNPSFREILRRVKRTCLEAYAHPELPFSRLVDVLQAERDPARSPLFGVMFVLRQEGQGGGLRLPGCDVEELKIPYHTAKFDLALEMSQSGAGLTGEIEYNTGLYLPDNISRLAACYQDLLRAGCEEPDRALLDFDILRPGEAAKLLYDFNRTEAPYQRTALPGLFREQAGRTPGNTALVHGSTSLTYAELDRESDDAAASLLQALKDASGTTPPPDTIIGLPVTDGPETIVCLLGILKAGCAYLPLDLDYPPERLAFMLEDSGAVAILVPVSLSGGEPRRRLEAALESMRGTTGRGAPPVVMSGKSRGEGCTVPVPSDERSLAYVIYTSGSSGEPKGVLVEQRGVANLSVCQREWFGIDRSSRVLQFAPLSFDASVSEIFTTLLAGAQLHLMDGETRRDAEMLLDLMEGQGITTATLPPALLSIMPYRKLPCLSTLVVAGDVCDEKTMRRWSGGRKLVNAYGPTEATVCASMCAWREGVSPGNIGSPMNNVKIYVLDGKMRPCPQGVPGELYLSGAGLARGYLNRPSLTEESFIRNPFNAASKNISESGGDEYSRLYRTGDLARWLPEGELEFLGRRDGQVKIRGYRVEPGEIEAAMMMSPAVARCAVAAARGEGAARLAAYWVATAGYPETPSSELRDFLKERLPSYMIPAVFVRLDEIPLTSSGKVDRKALPPLEAAAVCVEGDGEPPRTATEKKLAGIWRQVLKLERVGTDQDFFSLGGDSIMSIQVVSRAREAGLELSARDLYRYPTISALAARADRLVRKSGHYRKPGGEVPLTPVQHWFFELDLPEINHFNQAVMFKLEEGLEAGLVREAARRLARRHDSLRLRFDDGVDGGWRQWYAEGAKALDVPVYETDLTGREGELQAMCRGLQTKLDIRKGPVALIGLFNGLTDGRQRMLIAVHHLAIDAVSWQPLLEDFATIISSLSTGKPVRYGSIRGSSYQQWAGALQRYLEEKAAGQWDYWQGVGEGIRPVEWELGGGESKHAELLRLEIEMDAETTSNLTAAAPRAYHAGTGDLILAAFMLAWNRAMGRRELLLHLEGHGRPGIDDSVDMTRTTGWFTSIYPVLLKLPAARTHREDDELLAGLIKGVKEELRAVPDGGIGYGVLRYLSRDPRTLLLQEATPAEVAFNYLGRLDHEMPRKLKGVIDPRGPGAVISPGNPAPHPVEVNASIEDGKFIAELGISPRHLSRETSERLAREFKAGLVEIVEHCMKPGEGGHTPSDFPLARLSQTQVDSLTEGEGTDSIYGLTPMQEGLLFHSLYAPGSDQYLEQLCWTYHGRLETAALKKAWSRIVGRHAVFRTGFFHVGLERPVQVVRSGTEIDWREQDWRDLTPERQAEEFAGYIRRDRQEGFNLQGCGLTRFHLLRTGEEEYRFIWCFHHILIDGWCSSLILDELRLRYEALTGGRAFKLPPPPPYEEFLAWLNSRETGGDDSFWREQLANVDEPTPLGINLRALETLRPISEVGECVADLTVAETEEVTGFARRHHVTVNSILQTAWAMVLDEYGGRHDVVMGVNVSGRPGEIAGVEKMVGLFVNAVPVRFRLEEDSAALEAVSAMHGLMRDVNAHGYGSLAEVQRFSAVPVGTPLFFSEYVFENYPIDDSVLAWHRGISVSDFQAVEKTNYPLGLMAAPGGRLQLKAVYDVESFTAGSIRRMLTHLWSAVKWLVRNPGSRLGDAEMMPPRERQMVLTEWSGAKTAIPAEGTPVLELFRGQAAKHLDRPALSSVGERFTYGELYEASEAIAAVLDGAAKAAGRERNHMVGLFASRGARSVAALLGIMGSGAAFIPMDPDHPDERLRFTAEDAGLEMILTGKKLLPRLRKALSGLADIELLCLEDIGERPPPGWKSRVPDPEDVAYVIYTSGSTGTPKGAAITHRNLSDHMAAVVEHYAITPEDVVLQFSTLTFDASLEQVFQALVTGAALVMRGEQLWTPGELKEVMLSEGVTVINLPAGYFKEVVRDWSEEPGGITSSGLRLLIVGGDVLEASTAAGWRKLPLPPHRFLNAYGPTETTITATTFEIPEQVSEVVPVGRPVGARRLYVLRGDHPVPPGIPGELCIGGIGISPGYLHRTEANSERFRGDPFASPGERERGYGRIYRTGDVARWDDRGNLEFLGRLDFQTKLRGFRVEPQEIEMVLGHHPAVAGCAVVVSTEGDEKKLIAYYVAGPPLEGLAARLAEVARDAVTDWETIYDELFERDPGDPGEEAFDTKGWNSSYDGSPIPADDMREWVDQTVGRILELGPRSVLEIGCGTGLILTRVAPHCGSYIGVDFSAPAVARLRRHLAGHPIPGVEVLKERADGIAGITASGDRRFPVDTVVINSVAQYFPGRDYLERVLEQALDAVEEGSIFIGDIRDLRLQDAFYLSVEMARAGGIPDRPGMRALLASDVRKEKELLISPWFFSEFAARHRRIADVRIMPKEGDCANEMNDFRFDVVFKIGGGGRLTTPAGSLVETGWETGMDLERLLESSDGDVCLRGYPNRRIWAIHSISCMLDGPGDLEMEKAELDREADGFLTLWQLAALGAGSGYRLFPRLCLSGERAPALLDLFFMRDGPPPSTEGRTVPGEAELTSNPLERQVRETINPEELREFVSRRLPAYMIPSLFVELESLPVTATGKPDRLALSTAGLYAPSSRDGYVGPRNEQERLLANIFADVLQLEKVGITDDFFQLGGHSLSATRAASRIERVFGAHCPVKTIFEHPRVLELAPFVQGLLAGGFATKPQLAPAGARGRFPLSFAQERLWFLDRFESVGESSYHMPAAFLLEGTLDVAALSRSFDVLVERHQSLRTVFGDEGGEPYQLVRAPSATALSPMEVKVNEVEETLERLIRLPFDLEAGPLFRAHLLKTGEQRHVLLINQHHITGDAWSAGIIFEELCRCYEAFRRGREPDLAPLAVDYAGFAAWQKSWLKGETLRRQLDYWRGTLEGAPRLELPTSGPRVERTVRRGKQFSFRLDEEETARLKRLSRQAGASPYMAMLAAFSYLLGRYAGEDDVVLGTVVAGRTEEPLEQVVGFFVNTILLRIDLSGDPSYLELLERVRKTALEAFAHQDLPFEKLVAELRPERGTRSGTLFTTMLVYQNVPETHLRLEGLEVSPIGLELGAVRSDLDLYAWEDERTLGLCLVYDEDLFDEEIISRMAGRLTGLVASACKDGESPLSRLSFHEGPASPRPMIPPDDEETVRAPLSFHQERLWFIDRFEEGNVYEGKPIYHNLPLFIRFDGPVEARKLEESLHYVVGRHGALRTRIENGEDGAWQSVETDFRPALEMIAIKEAGPDPLLEKALEISGRPFTGEEEPRLRAALIRGAGGESVFVLVAHHMLADRRSMYIIARELAQCYGALAGGDEPELLPETLNYAWFSRWQREVPEAGWEPLFLYWKWRLRGELPVLTLPEDHPRPAIHTYTAGCLEFSIPLEPGAPLDVLTRSDTPGLSTILLSSLVFMLLCYAGQDELLIGVSGEARPREADDSVGPFDNLLPVRIGLDGQDTFRTMLKKVAEVTEEARANGSLPFDSLVGMLNPPVDMSRTALFDVIFEYRCGPEQPLSFGDIPARMYRNSLGLGKYDLDILLVEADDSIDGTATFNQDIYDRKTMTEMVERYATVIDNLAKAPDEPLEMLSLLTTSEESMQVWERNDTDVSFPAHQTVHGLFAGQAGRTPDRVAVACGDVAVSYRELDERANRLAHHLKRSGVGPERLVAICLERSVEAVTAMLAVLKAGGAYLPIEPSFPGERISFIIEDSGADLLVTTSSLKRKIPVEVVSVVLLDVDGESIDAMPGHEPEGGAAPDNLAYCIYTSGSTGRPKGVLVEHRNVVRLLVNDGFPFEFSEEDVWTMFHSYGFDFSVWEMYGALFCGGKLVIVPVETTRDSSLLLALIEKEGVTVINQVPSAFYVLAREILERRPAGLPLRYVIFGGEALNYSALEEWRRSYPEVSLVNMYGITETCVHVTFKEVRDGDIATGIGNIGRPLPDTRVYVMDRHLRLLPPGIPGELCVGGGGVARGYLGRDSLTASKFVPDPFRSGDRLYRSGDLGRYLPGGELEYLGRLDEQVQIRGFRVEPGEIENRLKEHPGVENAAVRAWEWRREPAVAKAAASGGADTVIAAYYVPSRTSAAGRESEAEVLKSYLAEMMPAYMVPSFMVRMDVLPVTTGGKIDRRALPDPRFMTAPSSTVMTPRDPVELHLKEIWEELIGANIDSIESDFFFSGGHSLLAVKLVARINRSFDTTYAVSWVFVNQTIEKQARSLRDEGGTTPFRPLVAFNREGGRPPLFFVHPGQAGAEAYGQLAALLDRDLPFYAIESRNLYEEGPMIETIESLAEAYLGDVLPLCGEGPCSLGGWSFGGLVALEMARRMEELGIEVEELYLLDATLLLGREKELLMELANGGKASDLVAGNSLYEDLPERYRDKLAEVMRLEFAAMAEYEAGLYQGHAVLILPMDDQKPNYWPEHIRELKVRTVPGGHLSMMEGRGLKEIARIVSGQPHAGCSC